MHHRSKIQTLELGAREDRETRIDSDSTRSKKVLVKP